MVQEHGLFSSELITRKMTRGLALLSEAYGKRLARLTGPEQAELKRSLEKLS